MQTFLLLALSDGNPVTVGAILGYETCLSIAAVMGEAWGIAMQCVLVARGVAS